MLDLMLKQVLLAATAVVLSLPLAHGAVTEWGPQDVVDYNSAAWAARAALVTRAKVFMESRPPEPAPIDPNMVVECRYAPKPASATTAKFDCRLSGGDIVKVKYGWTPERSGEVAATRLLAVLGFGADHVTMVPRLRCIGCPWFPFEMRRLAEAFFAVPLLDLLTPDEHAREFTWVSVERKMAGREIEVDPHEGWDWRELPTVDPQKGGATRAELDALRLMAIFLSHWDNKATNHRLLCEEGPGGDDPSAPCVTPILMLQDVGATFGPTKVNYLKWAGTPIWTHAPTCLVSMETFPYHGGNFVPIHISEGGRALLAAKLAALSDAEIESLFMDARFPGAERGDVTPWVRTFQDKVRQIREQRSCPTLPE